MKKTIFHFFFENPDFVKNVNDEKNGFTKEIDFIYFPSNYSKSYILISPEGEKPRSFLIDKICDEFTDNKDVQIRHVYLNSPQKQLI